MGSVLISDFEVGSGVEEGVGEACLLRSKGRDRPDDLLAQHRPFARFPERCRVDDPVAKGTAIGTIAARDRAGDAVLALATQGDDRVHSGRAPRRDVARQENNDHEDHRHSDKHFRI
jgi:hypothetical protein